MRKELWTEWLRLTTDVLFVRNFSATIIVIIFVALGLAEIYNQPSQINQLQKLTRVSHGVSMDIGIKTYQIYQR